MNQDSLNFDFQLKAIFIFNPKAIPKMPKPSEQDQQDAKLIFYYPSNANIDEKRIQTGMAEGIYVFFEQFNAPSQQMDDAIEQKNQENEELKYQTIHLEMQTHIICRINAELFLFMTLSHPKIAKIKTITEDYFYSECNKFHYSFSKNLYTNVAENYISNFALFYGYDLTQLDQYTWRWLQCNSRNSQLLNLLYFQCFSFVYARIDHSIFLLLQFLLTILRQLESQLTDFVVFYGGYFVYSTLPHKTALLLKEHYYGSGSPWQNQDQKILQKFLPPEGSQLAYLNFINLKGISKDTQFNAQHIYINNKSKHLFTYLEKQFFVIMISDIMSDYKNMIQVSLALKTNQEKISLKLESEIAQKAQDTTKYIYFNGMNLASKVSTQLNITKMSAENLRVLQSVYDKLTTSNLYVVRSSGLWFYGMKVVDKKLICLMPITISLSKIEEEVNKIIEQSFPNMLL